MRLLVFLLFVLSAAAKPPEMISVARGWQPPAALVDRMNEGVAAVEEGDLTAAESAAQAVLAVDPDCGLATAILGQVRVRQNRPAEAIVLLRRAVALYPKEPDAHGALAEALFVAQEFRDALAAGLEGIRRDPSNWNCVYFAMAASVRLGAYEGAQDIAAHSRAALPAGDADCMLIPALLGGDDVPGATLALTGCRLSENRTLIAGAEAQIAAQTGDSITLQARASELGFDAMAVATEGIRLMNARDCEGAVVKFEEALRAVPEEASLRVNRAGCLRMLGRDEEAEQELARIFTTDAWVRVEGKGAMTGIITHDAESRLRAAQAAGAGALIEMQAKRGALAEAAASVVTTRARMGEVPEIAAGEVMLSAALGDEAKAWAQLDAAMARWPGVPALARVGGSLSFEDPRGLTDTAAAYVQATGTPEDRLNVVSGQFNARRWSRCVDEAEAARRTDMSALTDQMATLSERCAAMR